MASEFEFRHILFLRFNFRMIPRIKNNQLQIQLFLLCIIYLDKNARSCDVAVKRITHILYKQDGFYKVTYLTSKFP